MKGGKELPQTKTKCTANFTRRPRKKHERKQRKEKFHVKFSKVAGGGEVIEVKLVKKNPNIKAKATKRNVQRGAQRTIDWEETSWLFKMLKLGEKKNGLG